MELRYDVRVGALPVSIRDSVDGARPSRSATSSSLMDCDSRSRRNSLPSRRRRTVGPTDTSLAPSRSLRPIFQDGTDWLCVTDYRRRYMKGASGEIPYEISRQ